MGLGIRTSLLAALICVLASAHAQHARPTTILLAKPNANVCTTDILINLCVSWALSAHIIYSLVDSGSVILSAVDDQTENGVSTISGYRLQCTAQLGTDTVTQIQSETGHLCTIAQRDGPEARVQVEFPVADDALAKSLAGNTPP
jgi:hypothetical protein